MWTPPRSTPRDTAELRSATSLPPDLAARIKQLTLTDLVDLALRSNPATQLSWANARSAASAYGVQRSAYFPTVDAAMWDEIRSGLRAEARDWLEALNAPRELGPVELTGMIASIAHLAYHLGAIRQINKSLRGPKEGTFTPESGPSST